MHFSFFWELRKETYSLQFFSRVLLQYPVIFHPTQSEITSPAEKKTIILQGLLPAQDLSYQALSTEIIGAF